MLKVLKRTTIACLIIYAVVMVGLYFIQDKLLFLPDQLSDDYQYRKGVEHQIPVADGLDISAYYHKSADAKGVIIYLHGNKGSIRRCMRQADMLNGQGYDILMPDYRSYGKSRGKIESEAQMLSDMQKVYDHALTMYDESQIVIMGYSMGSGMASYLAAENDPQQLFLVAPYKSLVDVIWRRFPLIPSFLIKFHFSSFDFLQKVICPITVFYATDDTVIPAASSLSLREANKAVDYHELKNTSHRGAIFHGKIREELSRKLK